MAFVGIRVMPFTVLTSSRVFTNWFGKRALSLFSKSARSFTVPVVVSIWLSIVSSLPEAILTNPDIARLFPNYVELEKEFYKRTKIYPIMHLVAIRKQVYEKYPFIATSLYNAFCESKKIALEKMYNLRALRYMTPFLMRDIDEIHEIFDGDPWPYGLEPNRPTLEAFVTYLTDQSLIAAPVPVDDLFVPTH